MELIFELLNENAKLPTYGTDDAADFDLYSPVNVTIQPHSKENIKLGLKVQIPEGYTLKFESRSGTSWKNSLEVGAGRIDFGFGEELGLILYNHSDVPYMVCVGDRVGQAIVQEMIRAEIKQGIVTDRNRSGLGSTGK